MTENILNLYNQVQEKMDFLKMAGNELEYSPATIKNNWVNGMQIIPQKHQKAFHGLLLNWLKQESARREAVIRENS